MKGKEVAVKPMGHMRRFEMSNESSSFFAIKNNPDEVSCLKSFTKDNTTYIWELEPHHHEHKTLDKVGKKIKLFLQKYLQLKSFR
jgi:hypothetical protein